MNHSLSQATTQLHTQPFSKLLNAEVAELGEDKVALRVPITGQVLQQHGFVHGGVVSYAADNALTYAGFLSLKQNVVTSEFKINYVRPAKGEALLARAYTVHAGKNQAVCRCDVFCVQDGCEVLCAVAQGTIVVMLPK